MQCLRVGLLWVIVMTVLASPTKAMAAPLTPPVDISDRVGGRVQAEPTKSGVGLKASVAGKRHRQRMGSSNNQSRGGAVAATESGAGFSARNRGGSAGPGSAASNAQEVQRAINRTQNLLNEVMCSIEDIFAPGNLSGCEFVPLAAAQAGGAGTGGGRAGSVPAAAPVVDPAVAARSAAARLPIPMPYAKIGPDPNINEWKMTAVGYPLWLWVEGSDQLETTVTEQGITLNLRASRISTRFDMGDGNQKMCAYTPRWHAGVEPGTPSPGCGHVYQQPSLPKGNYSVTATTVWEVDWAALGETGTVAFERTGPPTELPVGELVAVRTG